MGASIYEPTVNIMSVIFTEHYCPGVGFKYNDKNKDCLYMHYGFCCAFRVDHFERRQKCVIEEKKSCSTHRRFVVTYYCVVEKIAFCMPRYKDLTRKSEVFLLRDS